SSGRRHTRWPRDWSSDVCSSDLSVGDAYDNAIAESFFATLEREVLDRRRFKSQVEARMAVFEWIEGWYNPHRRHSGLGYRSPVRSEERRVGNRGGSWVAAGLSSD